MAPIWTPNVLTFRNSETSILETPHTVWKGPRSQIWTYVACFCNTFSRVSSEKPPGSLFERFRVPLGTQFGLKIEFKSYPNLDRNTMWPQKVPMGVHRSLQDPKMVPKGTHRVPNGPQIGTKKMTQGNPYTSEINHPGFARFGSSKTESGHHLDISGDLPANILLGILTR